MEALKNRDVYISWKRKWDFLFTTAGYTIGLGNVWRFSFMCYKYGGGVFIIPYLILAVSFVFPLFLMEACLGQWRRQGMINTWLVVPIMKGVGYAQLYVQLFGKIHYCILLVWILKYFVASFSENLPWNDCSRWNTTDCKSFNSNTTDAFNITVLKSASSASELYWKNDLLETSSGIDEMGSLVWDNVLYLTIVWVIVYLSVFKGVNWAVKIAYVTASLPCLLIVILVIRAVTLEGALDGIKAYLLPDFSKLKNLELWTAAATQVLYSTAVGSGVYTSLRSHNSFYDNIFRDGMLIIFGNFLTSFICGLGTFSTLGFMAHYMNTTVDQVVDSGLGLVFITYPQTLSLLPLPQLWCAIFFILLFLLGFDTQFAGTEVVIDTIIDLLPRRWLPTRYKKEIISLLVCSFFFVIALVFVTQGGIYVFHLVNHFTFSWNMLLLTSSYFLAFGWLYGAENFWMQLEKMNGPSRLKHVIIFLWKYLGPVISLGLAVQVLVRQKPLTYGSYVYPLWANVIGHTISAGCIACIVLYAIYIGITSKKKFIELIGRAPSVTDESCLEYLKSEKKEEI